MSEKRKIDVKELIKSSLPIIIFFLLLVALTVYFWPYIATLGTKEGRQAFKAWTDELGFGGWIVSLGIQLLQVFVAFIPGEPIELMMGYVWGPWLGALTCLLGIFIGATIIYFLVRKLGMKFVRKMVGTDDLTKYKFLSNQTRVELTVFILFFIPGTPKDALNYIAPIAPITPLKYMTIATFARIPSVVSSTVLGDSVADGRVWAAVLVFAVMAVISVVGIILGRKYIERKQKKHSELSESEKL